LGVHPKQNNQKQQDWDRSEYGRSKSVSRPGRRWVFGALTDAGVGFGAGHRSTCCHFANACVPSDPAQELGSGIHAETWATSPPGGLDPVRGRDNREIAT